MSSADVGTVRTGRRFPSIRIGFLGRIILSLAAAGLIPLALLSFRLSELNSDALFSQVLQTHSLSANTGAESIERIITSLQAVLDGVATHPAVAQTPESTEAREVATNAVVSREDIVAIAVDDAAGTEMFRAQKKTHAAAVARLLTRDARPTVRLPSDGAKRWLVLTRPLENGGRATLVADGSAIVDALRTTELRDEAARILIDRERNLVAGSTTALRELPAKLLQMAADGRVRGSGRFLARTGIDVVAAYSPVTGTPWIVVSSQPAVVAEQVSKTLRRRSAVAIGAALLLVGGLSLAAFFIVVRPVNDLLEAQTKAGLVASGEGSDVDRLRNALDLLQKRVRVREALGQVFLGRFQVLEALGEGGMGLVFRGWDPKLQRSVALKTIRLTSGTESERQGLVAALVREAVTIARFHHPNIVSVYDVQESRDAAFIAMEFVDGVTLEDQLEIGPMTFVDASAVALAIATGLDAAHRAGVIHRDVKPGNVLLGRDGSIKVMDFGIAELLNAMRPDQETVYGTPGYLAPELIRGRSPSPASDFFSLGALLYRCVTGISPFERGSLQATLQATLRHDPRSPRTIDHRIPETLDRIIMQLLEKNPEKRLSAAPELISRLATVANENKVIESTLVTTERASEWRGQETIYVRTIPVAQSEA